MHFKCSCTIAVVCWLLNTFLAAAGNVRLQQLHLVLTSVRMRTILTLTKRLATLFPFEAVIGRHRLFATDVCVTLWKLDNRQEMVIKLLVTGKVTQSLLLRKESDNVRATSNVYLRKGSLTISCAATLRQRLQINLQCYLTQSQNADTGPTSPSADPISQARGKVASKVPPFK